MPDLYHDKVVPFEVDHIAFELLGDYETVWYLARERHLPDLIQEFRRRILTHNLHSIGSRHRFGVRKSAQKSADSEPMVSVAVCNVDGCKALALSCNPIC